MVANVGVPAIVDVRITVPSIDNVTFATPSGSVACAVIMIGAFGYSAPSSGWSIHAIAIPAAGAEPPPVTSSPTPTPTSAAAAPIPNFASMADVAGRIAISHPPPRSVWGTQIR